MNQALEQEFREKTLSKEQAAALVQSGQGVYIGCCTSYARAIADAIAACGLPASVRGEALTLTEFAALTDALAERK